MKKIEIKTYEEIKLPDGQALTTKNLIYIALSSSPDKGFAEDDDEKRGRIREAVKDHEEGNPILLLEDADHTELVRIVNTMAVTATGWPFASPVIKEFCTELRAAKSFKPAKLSDLKGGENGAEKTEEVTQA